jgi:hypothetical protein
LMVGMMAGSLFLIIPSAFWIFSSICVIPLGLWDS